MKKILLLEKGGKERAIIGTSLEKKGFHVVRARDERSAVTALLCGQAIDLAIVIMPDCDWTEFLIAARAARSLLPVILLTNCDADKPLLRNRFPGVTSLSLRQQRYTSEKPLLLRELDRQIRLAFAESPALAA